MKLIFFTDVHANRPALDALLRAVAPLDADLLIHGGDVVAIGPEPEACLARLLALPRTRLLQGNHDHYFAAGLQAPRPDWMSAGEYAHQRWTHARLDAALRPVVGGWPWSLRLPLGGQVAYFCHYALLGAGELAPLGGALTPGALDALFAGVDADFIFFGHEHRPVDVTGRCRYVNPGALGCSPTPVARYLLVEAGRAGVTITHEAVPYDDDPLWAAYAARAVPERAFLARVFHGGRRRLAE